MKIILIIFLSFLLSCTPDSQTDGHSQKQFNGNSFFDDFNGDQINSEFWRVATWKEHGGQTGTDRCYVKDGYLNLLFINDPVKGFLSSAIESRKEFLYGKWEARLKPSEVKGILNSFYTIDWDDPDNPASTGDGTHQEIDIELLTKSFGVSSGRVHLAVHESGKTSMDTNPDILLDFNPSDDFHVWGFEITPEKIRWFVDGKTLLSYSYTGNPIAINSPYQIKLNFWSQSGSGTWIAGPPPAGEVCRYQIDWIRFTPAAP